MKLNNLVAIVDRNHKTVLGTTEKMTHLDAFPDRWLSFGWNVNVVDGHNIADLKDVLKKLENINMIRLLNDIIQIVMIW